MSEQTCETPRELERPQLEIHAEGYTITITMPSHWSPAMREQYAKWVGDALNEDSWRKIREQHQS